MVLSSLCGSRLTVFFIGSTDHWYLEVLLKLIQYLVILIWNIDMDSKERFLMLGFMDGLQISHLMIYFSNMPVVRPLPLHVVWVVPKKSVRRGTVPRWLVVLFED